MRMLKNSARSIIRSLYRITTEGMRSPAQIGADRQTGLGEAVWGSGDGRLDRLLLAPFSPQSALRMIENTEN